jgi:hypothetical protein
MQHHHTATHAPLPYGDMRREFWCGLDWFDAEANCPQKCPSGGDEECFHPLIEGLRCITGVASCKDEMGYAAYGITTSTVANVASLDGSGGGDEVTTTGSTELNKDTAATKPAALDTVGSTQSAQEIAATTAIAEETVPLQGPFQDDMVRIILYGLDTLDSAALTRWTIMTTNYFEEFFNDFDDSSATTSGKDVIRIGVYDVSVEMQNIVQEMAPEHDFNPLIAGEDIAGRKLLQLEAVDTFDPMWLNGQVRGLQATDGESKPMVMITYQQLTSYRSTLDVINEGSQYITRRPLETPRYRAEYVSYLRAQDYATFGSLEFVSHFLYTEFPTAAPSGSPTLKPSTSPVEPGKPTLPPMTSEPTTPLPVSVAPSPYPSTNLVCNLCRPGQYGVNANVIWNDEVSTCVEIYNYFLENYREGSGGCRDGQAQLSSICCQDGQPVVPPTREPTQKPIAASNNAPAVTEKPSSVLEIPVDENGLPDAATLAETYYCGVNWNAVDADCSGATACPSGDSNACPSGEQCIAFTNCGGHFTFVSDPNINGGGPDPNEVKSTFYCGTSMQFLEMKCDGATPCPNGPKDCTGSGEGCFAFTGCNAAVDPGSFVGFLAKPSSPSASAPVQSPVNFPIEDFSVENQDLLKSTFFCGTSVEEIDQDCANAKPCPNGDECGEGEGCFSFSICGGIDIDSLVDTFGLTDSPTRAPTIPIEQVCDEQAKMSVNVGYWQSWSIYRDENCQKMNTASFDASSYTHAIYSFASIDSRYRLEAWNGTYDNEVPLYKEFNTVKQRHSGIKTMIAVGGWSHNDPGPMQKRFSEMAASKTNRQTFAKSVVQFLRTYGFDGLGEWIHRMPLI